MMMGIERRYLLVRLSKFGLLVGDLLAFVLAFAVSTLLILSTKGIDFQLWISTQHEQRFFAWGFVAVFGLFLLLTNFQHYSDRRPYWDELADFLKLIGILCLIDISIISINRWEASRLWWGLSWSMSLIILILMRHLTRSLLSNMHLWNRPTVVLGVGTNAVDALAALNSHPELGLKIVGLIDVGGIEDVVPQKSFSRMNISQMLEIASQQDIHWIIALEHTQSDLREHCLRLLAQSGAIDISVIPAMRGVPLHGTNVSYFFSHEVAMLKMRNNLLRWPARLTKRIFDFVGAFVLVLLLGPLMLAIAFWVRRDGGPALFSHPRVGKNEKIFNCYKFRTMVVDAELQLEQMLQNPELKDQWEREKKIKNDPRVIPAGHFLRSSSLDELPQLFNVLLGDMSLVGPRPVVKNELSKYAEDVGYYLMVHPGMTGLWQVSGRSDISYESRVYLDTWYVKNWSIWYDLVILFKTVRSVILRSGAY